MMLALADAGSGRLLHTLSVHGPASADQLAAELELPPGFVAELLRNALRLGAVQREIDERYRADPTVIADLVRKNYERLLGEAA